MGSGPGLVGAVHIEGAGARWTLSDELIIHEGPVNVLDGGVLDAQLSIDVGMEPTAAAQLAMLEGGLVADFRTAQSGMGF